MLELERADFTAILSPGPMQIISTKKGKLFTWYATLRLFWDDKTPVNLRRLKHIFRLLRVACKHGRIYCRRFRRIAKRYNLAALEAGAFSGFVLDICEKAGNCSGVALLAPVAISEKLLRKRK